MRWVLPDGFEPSSEPVVLGTQLGWFLVLGRAPASGGDEPEGLVDVLELIRTEFLVDLYDAVVGPLVPAREWV